MIMKAHLQFSLERDVAGRLVLTDRWGKVHVDVVPVRSFPISEPDGWISLLDGHGREIACVDDLAHVSPDIRELIRQELAEREFLPRIERVVRVLTSKEPHVWDVITDRGPVQFLLRDDDDIRRLGPHRAILVDMHGVRFYIPDSRQLDAKSRRILSQYL
jgi:Domain of unknown function (DUF1854)